MAMQYGNNVATYATQTSLNIVAGTWTALRVGTTNLSGRQAIRIFVRGNPGMALAIAYANQNADGTFTTPTVSVRQTTVYPGGRTWIEPLSDKVTIYGQLVKKAGATDSSVKVVVTEYN